MEKAIRAALVREARDALKKLTAEEAEELLTEAQDPHFWIGKQRVSETATPVACSGHEELQGHQRNELRRSHAG